MSCLLRPNGDFEKVGTANVGYNYNYPKLIEIKDISVDSHYSHPDTYTYFTKAIIDKSKKQGAYYEVGMCK